MNPKKEDSLSNPKVTVGLPVYNGEDFIAQAIDSVLTQTFTNFELVISDNASDDLTPKICDEYLEKDFRIKYIRHEKNQGPYWNFNYVLEQAKGKYFAWLAADDYWHSDFLRKNIEVLDSKKNVVCSFGKVETYKRQNNDLVTDSVQYPKFIRNYVLKRRDSLISATYPLSGKFKDKVRSFLKNPGSNSMFYGLYRTDDIRKCFIKTPFVAVENAIFLNLLRLGDLYQVEQVLMYRFNQGISTVGIIRYSKNVNKNFLGVLFPYYPFNGWCLKNIGLKNILRNFDIFARLNLGAPIFICVDLILKLKNQLSS